MDIVGRAKNIFLSPNTEWPVIAAEPTTVGTLYSGYIAPMTAIGPVCSLVALLMFFGGIAMGAGFIAVAFTYVLNLAATFIVAMIAQYLAPQFGGRADIVAALKLVAYSTTPAWIGGIFNLIPSLAILNLLLALYGFYLLYTGATPVVNVPQEKAVTFTVVLVIAVIVVFVITGFILSAILGGGRVGMMG
jgi:hypothetical protein